jgi:L-type amino acid transporter 9
MRLSLTSFSSPTGALAFAELGTVVPRSGAEYAYFQEAYGGLHRFWGPLPSFICSWVYVVILRPAEVAVIILTFSEYICQPFAYHMVCMPAETQEVVKKIIAILGLGQEPSVCFRDLVPLLQ